MEINTSSKNLVLFKTLVSQKKILGMSLSVKYLKFPTVILKIRKKSEYRNLIRF